MSVIHFIGAIMVGAVVGKLFATFTLRKVKGGKYTFMAFGAAGSLAGDLFFNLLYEHELVSNFFYAETTIIFEMIAGAGAACYLLNLLGKKQVIAL